MNPYKVLGVEPTAPLAEIKKAFQRAAKSLHPDRAGGNEERAKEINVAWGILKDAELREHYDATHTVTSPDEIRKKADSLFRQMAGKALGSQLPNVVARLQSELKQAFYGLAAGRADAERRLERCDTLLSQVTTKGRRNVIKEMVEEEQRNLEQHLEQLFETEAVLKLVQIEADQYEMEQGARTGPVFATARIPSHL